MSMTVINDNVSNVIDINNMAASGQVSIADFNSYPNTATGIGPLPGTYPYPWDTGTTWKTPDQEAVGTVVDEDGEVIAITDTGQRVNISKWAKRDILERIKEFFEQVVLQNNEPEKDLETLVSLRILFDMYEEEVNMAKKYLELAERFTYERTFLADVDSGVQEETMDSEQGEVDALPDQGETGEGVEGVL